MMQAPQYKRSDPPQSLWRSEKMEYVQMIISRDSIHATLDELGQLGIFHFRDMNPTVNAAKREFIHEVRRCDELQRRLRFFNDQVEKSKLSITPQLGETYDMNELEAHFEEQEKELKQMNSHEEVLHKHRNELVEMRHVLTLASAFFDRATSGANEELMALRADDEARASSEGSFQNAPGLSSALRLGFMAGVIARDRLDSFHRIIYMALRGNCFVQQVEIPEPLKDPTSGEPIQKNVFVVFFSGPHAQSKISKICESFAANLYPFPEAPTERRATLEQVESRLSTLDTVISRTVDLRERALRNLGSHIQGWTAFVAREKSIFATMNLLSVDTSARCLIGEGWVPTIDMGVLQSALQRAQDRSHSAVPPISTVLRHPATPPTFFRTNKFTDVYQAVVESYGTATYGEINPALFSVVTFPFLFAVMFGDFAHGLLLLGFSLFLLWKEKEWKALGNKLNEMIRLLFDGRYMLLLMSLFSVYMGLLYNETFSVAMNLFGSGYTMHVVGGEAEYEFNHPYIFGMDPVWRDCENLLIFTNSIKMKMAVIIGVSQMMVGIVFHLLNAIHFKNHLNIWFEFLPQFLLMGCMFGYLCIIIYVKWWTVYTTIQPPQLIHAMIYMFLDMGHVDPSEQVYAGQATVQTILIVIIIICVPMLLLPKPIILNIQHKRGYKEIGAAHEPGEAAEEFSFGECFVEQLIETIEFVLGCVSNTASYLRLWALSLAHGELAAVFWYYGVVFCATLGGFASYVAPVVGICVWIGATLGILMGMEALSAFLHALRLHWVEFQNKFYKALGYPFEPLDFSKIDLDSLLGGEQ